MPKDYKDIREAYEEDWEADRTNRDEAANDAEFLVGDPWPTKVRQQREKAGRPVHSVNRLGQFIRQVAGDLRQSSPSVEVYPVNDEEDQNIAAIREGLIRQIEYQSGASQVYAYGAECAIAYGMGHWRITTEYSSDSAFDQEIYVRRITDHLAVTWDGGSQRLDRSDAKRCTVTDLMPRSEYEDKYGEFSAASFPDSVSSGFNTTGVYWLEDDKVRIAEYWCVEDVPTTIGLTQDGQTISLDQFKPSQYQFLGLATGSGSSGDFKIRKTTRAKIIQYIINGQEILEGPNDWAGAYIPIIPCIGNESPLNGRIIRYGLIRFAKDSQRLYNYWRSISAESISLAPKAPFLVTPEQIKGLEGWWQQANNMPWPYLPYNPDERVPGPPQRSPAPEPPNAMWQEATIATDDMKASMGLYNTSLGAPSNETSGRAILARQHEGDTGTYVFFDNFSVAIRRTGEVLNDLLPKIYDADRQVRVLDRENKQHFVPINRIVQLDRVTGQTAIINDLSQGRYDVRVRTGPSYSTAREQAREEIGKIMQANPQAFMVIADLYLENSDFPGAQSMAERFKKLLPPQLQDQPPVPQQPDPTQVAMQRLAVADAQAKVMKTQAETQKTQAQTEQVKVETATNIVHGHADLQHKGAKTAQMNVATVKDALTPIPPLVGPAEGPTPETLQNLPEMQQ